MSGASHADPATDRVRVLVVAPSMKIVGGQSIQAHRLLKALGSSEVVSVRFLPVNPELPAPLNVLQRVKYLRTISTSVAYLFSLLRAAKECDVVHAFSASYWSYLLAPLPALLTARLYRKPTILNYRSGEAADHLATWKSAVPTIRRFANVVVTPSGYLVETFARHSIEAYPIPNFVDLEKFAYRARDKISPRFFCNRNHEAHYDVACALRAFAIVQKAFPDATLVVAGDGPQRAGLEDMARVLRLNARFVGRVGQEEMAVLYNQADIFLNTPLIDNMPGSILEAFACGVPVVTTNAGGIPWIVRDSENGLMAEAGSPEQVAAAALRLLREPGFGARLASSARDELEAKYTWPVVRHQWEELYTSLYRTKGNGRLQASGAGNIGRQSGRQ